MHADDLVSSRLCENLSCLCESPPGLSGEPPHAPAHHISTSWHQHTMLHTISSTPYQHIIAPAAHRVAIPMASTHRIRLVIPTTSARRTPPRACTIGPLSLSRSALSLSLMIIYPRACTIGPRECEPPRRETCLRRVGPLPCEAIVRAMSDVSPCPEGVRPLFNRHRKPDFDRIESNRFQHHLILTGEHKQFRRHKPPCPEGVRRLGTGLVPVRRQGFSVFTALSLREPFRAPAFAVWACRRHALGALWTGGPEEPI